MKKLMLVLPLLALAACEGSIASAVGEAGKSGFADGKEIGTTATDPGQFDGVALAGQDNVIFTTDAEFSIRAEGDPDVIEQLRYKLSDGQLKIGRKKNSAWRGMSGAANVYVTAPSLKSIKLAGAGDMEADKMDSDSAKISVAGSGNVKVADLQTASLTTKIAGSGDVSVAGQADEATISIAGSGDISGKGLKADNATIKVAGSGDVALSSDGTVNATVVGSGDIRIHGDATCKTKSRGSGDITCG